VIIQSFERQIALAVKLLEAVKEVRSNIAIVSELIEEAARVCKQFTDTEARVPELRTDKEWQDVQHSVRRLLSALQEIASAGSTQ
jgi:hypothetical protein